MQALNDEYDRIAKELGEANQNNCQHLFVAIPHADLKSCKHCGKVSWTHSFRAPRFDRRGRVVR